MGGVVKKVVGGVGKIFGIDQSAATKASKEQAQATRDASAQVAQDNAYAAQANAQQIQAQSDQAAARQRANDLLGKPMQTADVDLSQNDGTPDDGSADDLLGLKKGGVRGTYRNRSNSGLKV